MIIRSRLTTVRDKAKHDGTSDRLPVVVLAAAGLGCLVWSVLLRSLVELTLYQPQ